MSVVPYIPPDPRLVGKKIEVEVFDLSKPEERTRLAAVKTAMLKRLSEILVEERSTTPGGKVLVYLEWIEYQKISAALGEIDPDAPLLDPVDEEDYEDQIATPSTAKPRFDADEMDALKSELDTPGQ